MFGLIFPVHFFPPSFVEHFILFAGKQSFITTSSLSNAVDKATLVSPTFGRSDEFCFTMVFYAQRSRLDIIVHDLEGKKSDKTYLSSNPTGSSIDANKWLVAQVPIIGVKHTFNLIVTSQRYEDSGYSAIESLAITPYNQESCKAFSECHIS